LNPSKMSLQEGAYPEMKGHFNKNYVSGHQFLLLFLEC
jgi:hypothetical protein